MSKNKFTKHNNVVNSFLNNELKIKHNLPSINISKGIDWDYLDNKNSSTYQVYLQSLTVIESLTYIGIENADFKLLKSAKKIILDWYKYNSNNRNKFIWNEHAAANRVQNIIYFQQSEHNNKISKYHFNRILEEHCEFLSQSKNYKENNHGLMMDKALIKACQFLRDKQLKRYYLQTAILRVKVSVYRDFSKSGLHLENSPEYHILVLNILKEISIDLDNFYNISLGKDIEDLIKRAQIIKKYLIKPDGEYINLGDTGTIKDKNLIHDKIYKDFIDYDAGTVIFQYKNYSNNRNSSYFTFSCGYKKLTHKHKDDLSFTLFLDGQDVLVDSGKFNYNYTDPLRKFITSPLAHNSLVVEGTEYEYFNAFKDQPKLKVAETKTDKNYKKVIGINKLYKNKSLKRYCILTKSNILFVLDEVNGKSIDNVFQNFNFHEDALINKVTNSEYKISLNNNNYILCNLYTDYPLLSKIKKGNVSRAFSKSCSTNRILFKQKGMNFKFLTILCNENQKEVIKTVNFTEKEISYEWKNKKYIIPI